MYKPPKSGIVSTKNRVAGHERAQDAFREQSRWALPTAQPKTPKPLKPTTGIVSTQNRLLAHEQWEDAQAPQADSALEARLKALENTLIVQPDRLVVTKSLQVYSGILHVNGMNIFTGNGSPEGRITAGRGSLYMRLNGGASTTLYVKTSGTGNTGWTAK